jgi:hypothetical protein
VTEPAKKTLGRKIFDGFAVATLAGFVVFCAIMILCAASIDSLRRRERERRFHPQIEHPFDR